MTNLTEAEKFLQVVFPDWATHAIFANLNPPSHTRDFRQLDPGRDCYWSIAAFPPEAVTNLVGKARGVRALVVDDIGTKVDGNRVLLALGHPTAIVETSAGNFQWTYRLSEEIPVDRWAGFFAGIEKLVGQKLEGKDAVHLFRLPMGINTKEGRNSFGVRLFS